MSTSRPPSSRTCGSGAVTTTTTITTRALLLSLLALSACSQPSISPTNPSAAPPYTNCAVGAYYPTNLDKSSHAALHEHLKATHRNVVPYTSTALDTWDALIQLDSTNPPTNSQVNLIYRNIPMDSSLAGSTEGWNREHCWPKSVGVGYTGADFTDLHHLRPADWSVNSARSNRFYGDCLATSVAAGDCSAPATSECPPDTMSDKVDYRWTPPTAKRGDIARAMFYMATRYDGEDDPDGKDLKLSDCPVSSLALHGYLSDLLRWHAADPVDAAERKRNDDVCEKYQGVRNPFVDFPDLVAAHYGAPAYAAGEKKLDCVWQTAAPTPASPTSATPPPTKAPSPPSSSLPTTAPSKGSPVGPPETGPPSSPPAPGVSVAAIGGGVAAAVVALGAVALFVTRSKCGRAGSRGGGAGDAIAFDNKVWKGPRAAPLPGLKRPGAAPLPGLKRPGAHVVVTAGRKSSMRNQQNKQMELV